jgi:hypothetical protein
MATGTVSLRTDVPTLNHHLKRRKLNVSCRRRGQGEQRHTDLRDDAMELASLVAESGLSSRELAEVARGPRTDIIVELEDDSSGGFGVDCDVKLWAGQR